MTAAARRERPRRRGRGVMPGTRTAAEPGEEAAASMAARPNRVSARRRAASYPPSRPTRRRRHLASRPRRRATPPRQEAYRPHSTRRPVATPAQTPEPAARRSRPGTLPDAAPRSKTHGQMAHDQPTHHQPTHHRTAYFQMRTRRSPGPLGLDAPVDGLRVVDLPDRIPLLGGTCPQRAGHAGHPSRHRRRADERGTRTDRPEPRARGQCRGQLLLIAVPPVVTLILFCSVSGASSPADQMP